MNAERRKSLEKALSLIEDAKIAVDEAMSEEQDYYDNMPESFQSGEKGDRAQSAVDSLQSALDSLDEAVSGIEEAVAQ